MTGDTDIFITDLESNVTWLAWENFNQVKRDILLFFHDNCGEAMNIFVDDSLNLDYWKFINADTVEKWSKDDCLLLIDGSLAILNGICHEILDEPLQSIGKQWNNTSLEEIIKYIELFDPKTEKHTKAKKYLLKNFQYIANASDSSIDENGLLKDFDLIESGKWFNEYVVMNYYEMKINTHANKE